MNGEEHADLQPHETVAAPPVGEASVEAPADASMEAPEPAPTEEALSAAETGLEPLTPAMEPTTDAAIPALSRADAKAQVALKNLLQRLDAPEPAEANASPAGRDAALRSLQKMCMRVPNLSNELSGPQRYQLYCRLLLDLDSVSEAAVPDSWTVYTERALEAHIAAAQQAVSFFPPALEVRVEELSGLLYHLGAETAFYFNEEMVQLILCIASVVGQGGETEKTEALRSLYQLLAVLQKDFIVSTASRLYELATVALLRLMLQFFDPALVTHLDQQQVDVGTYVLDWSRGMLIMDNDYATALKVLDWVFILGDPVMVPYVAMAYPISHRQHLFQLQTKQELTGYLSAMTFALPHTKEDAMDPKLEDGRAMPLAPVWSGKSLLQNADLLYRMTPLSTQRMLDFCLYPDVGTLNKTPEDLQLYYANTPCLPLERSDLAAAFPNRGTSQAGVRQAELPSREYVIVDCRSEASYNYVRLPTAVLVGDVLSYQQEELEVVMARLESCRGRPLALFGTGRPIVEEMNLLKILALYLMHKKAFPFVAIVPGGFKTTIPLLRNGAMEAIMSDAAAAALRTSSTVAAARGANADWGQQASNTAHQITAKLSEITELLPHMETSEVRHKAEELGNKAKEGVAAASTWGWGMMQRLREGFNETREQASVALSSASTHVSSVSRGGAVDEKTTMCNNGIGGDGGSHAHVVPASGRVPHPSNQPSTQSLQQIFSLGDEGEEDDLDLITSIPTRPMRGMVVTDPASASASVAVATAHAAPAEVHAETVSTVTEAVAPEMPPPPAGPAIMGVADHEETFTSQREVVEVSSTPPRSHDDAVSVEARQDASPAPLPPTLSAAAVAAAPPPGVPSIGGSPRVASASAIAADIDAEFDELFGDLNTSPVGEKNGGTSLSKASPNAAGAAQEDEDPFLT